MNRNEKKDFYHVITSGDKQYSIWPVNRAIPKGWQAAGGAGSKVECFDYIKEIENHRIPWKEGSQLWMAIYQDHAKKRQSKK